VPERNYHTAQDEKEMEHINATFNKHANVVAHAPEYSEVIEESGPKHED
jgi:hypothetical protein